MDLNPAEARRIVRWFRRRFGLLDWRIKVTICEDLPGDVDEGTVATCSAVLLREQADICVSNGRCRLKDVPPGVALIHELVHALLRKAGMKGDGRTRAETAWNRLDGELYRLYMFDMLVEMEKRKR